MIQPFLSKKNKRDEYIQSPKFILYRTPQLIYINNKFRYKFLLIKRNNIFIFTHAHRVFQLCVYNWQMEEENEK